jgi:hypothetical protein
MGATIDVVDELGCAVVAEDVEVEPVPSAAEVTLGAMVVEAVLGIGKQGSIAFSAGNGLGIGQESASNT